MIIFVRDYNELRRGHGLEHVMPLNRLYFRHQTRLTRILGINL